MKCVAFLGTFLDVSDVDMTENNNFGMSYLEFRFYFAINLSSLFKPENYGQKKVRIIL